MYQLCNIPKVSTTVIENSLSTGYVDRVKGYLKSKYCATSAGIWMSHDANIAQLC